MTEDGDRRVVEDEDSQSVSADSVRTANGNQLAALVSAAQQSPSRREPVIAPGESVAIATGVYDDSGPAPTGVSGEVLDITVTDPNGGTTSFSVTTDTDGSGTVTYDLSSAGDGNGTYDLTVTNSSGTSLTTSFEVGYDVLCTSNFSGGVLVNDETRFEFLALAGVTAASGLELTLRVVDDDTGDTVVEQTETTDADGFADISFTLQSAGSYRVEADRNGQTVVTENVEGADLIGLGTYEMGAALVGQTNWYPGLLVGPNGFAANLDCTVKIYTDYAGGNLLVEKSTSTDEHGFFAIEYDIPDDFGDDFLPVVVEPADGKQVVLAEGFISVSDPDSGGGGGGDSPVDLSADLDSYNYGPGETATITVEATDDDAAITDQDVDVFLRYDGGPPVRSKTVTTDSNGAATVSVTLPGVAFDGIDIDGSAGMSYGGDTYTDSLSSNLREHEYNFNYPDLTPGGSTTYTMDVTETTTGDPAEGVPVWFDATYAGGKVGSFAADRLVTGSDGTAEKSVPAPTDLGFEGYSNNVRRYWDQNIAAVTDPDYPGSLSANGTPAPGESADFSFSVPDDVSLTGIAFGEEGDKTFGTAFTGTGTFSVTIPSEVEPGEYIDLTVWAVDDQGQKYNADTYVETAAGSIDVTASGQTGVSPGGQATVSLSAQKVDQLTVEKVWTDWALSSSDPDGGSVTDQIGSAGEVTVSYGSVQQSVGPSLTVSLPQRYVGGTFELTVSASNDSGGSAQDTSQITIQ